MEVFSDYEESFDLSELFEEIPEIAPTSPPVKRRRRGREVELMSSLPTHEGPISSRTRRQLLQRSLTNESSENDSMESNQVNRILFNIPSFKLDSLKTV